MPPEPAAAPVLIHAQEAGEIVALLAPRFPEERFLAVPEAASLDAALALDPQIAFTIKGRPIAEADHGRIARHPSMRWLHVGGSGYEHVGAWDPDRITLTNCLGALAPFLAETCIGAILALNHGLIAYRDQQRAHVWRDRPFRPLMGQTLLIVGAGAIGGELARRAAALGLHVVAIRASGREVPGAAEVRPPDALEASLGEADIVSLHLRLTPQTQGLFDTAMFARMRPGALFLNTARGGHVVEPDLIAALESGHLAGAYLDVFQTEPLPPDSPLWDVPGLLISPHSADGVGDWVARFTDVFADNLAAWRKGRPLRNRVG